MDDLHALPKIRDSLSYLYVEHAKIDRHEKSIAVWGEHGHTPVPAAALCVLMVGPGTTVSHAAVQTLADNNCLVVWCGEENVRFYAFGTGGTRSSASLLLQARLFSNDATRLEVVRRMYQMRFSEWPPTDSGALTIEQMRGLEGARMRAAYAEAAKRFGVAWEGRNYDRNAWDASDPVNRALSAANSCLYGLCHAAILATGYSPGIGFIHTGKQLSFVYDLADLYKTEITIPVAFQVAAAGGPNIERTARLLCRDKFRETKLLSRIVPDLQRLFGGKDAPTPADASEVDSGAITSADVPSGDFDNDKALPGALWAPQSEGGAVAGGVAYASSSEGPVDPAPEPQSESATAGPEEEDAGPFIPDPGRETPPWGTGKPPWERGRSSS